MKKGFTVVELMVTLLVVGIISLIAIPYITSVINDAKLKSAETSMGMIIKNIDFAQATYQKNHDGKLTSDFSKLNFTVDDPNKVKDLTAVLDSNGDVVTASATIDGFSCRYNKNTESSCYKFVEDNS